MTSNHANKELGPIAEFRSQIEGKMQSEIGKALPHGLDPDRFIRTVITTVQLNPDLLSADRRSLFGACMQAAKDGLLPDGKEATIQVYNTNVAPANQPKQYVKMAQYMPMVRGLISKMYGAGCTKVDAAAVYEKDRFLYLRGDDDRIEHAPYLGDEDPGPVVASYAIIKLNTGEIKREVMTRRDIEKVRAASKQPNGGPWTTWYDQNAIKAVLKRASKQLPDRNPLLERIFESDNKALGITMDHGAVDTSAVTGEDKASTPGASSRLRNIVKPSGQGGADEETQDNDGLEPEGADEDAEQQQ